jgi:hypothetical protein
MMAVRLPEGIVAVTPSMMVLEVVSLLGGHVFEMFLMDFVSLLHAEGGGWNATLSLEICMSAGKT